MKKKLKISFCIFYASFILGNFLVYIGILKGTQLAIFYSRPSTEIIGWNVPENIINAFTYGITISGISLIIVSFIVLVLTMVYWFKN